MGLLDDLKKQADALKAQDVDKTESLRSSAVTVDHALRRSFLYLNDLLWKPVVSNLFLGQ